MSTRGTYKFKGNRRNFVPDTYIYVHYDNYPEGAAAQFYNLLINPSKGNMATQFIRSNEHAEITKNHDCHGDTEYRYEIEGHGPEAEVICYERQFPNGYDYKKADNQESWVGIAVQKLHEFISERTKYIKDYRPFKEVTGYWGHKRWLNSVTAQREINGDHGCLHHLRAWKGRFEGQGNWQSQIAELQILINAFPELATDEINEFLKPVGVK